MEDFGGGTGGFDNRGSSWVKHQIAKLKVDLETLEVLRHHGS
jgi:hypothetical protein